MTTPTAAAAYDADQQVPSRWTYWPVSFAGGNLVVISNVSLPLSGVQFARAMREVGEFRAALQLTDDEVQEIYPWDKIIPRKTGIVAVRETFDFSAGRWVSEAVDFFVVYAAPTNIATGRMEITAFSVESVWARRLITKAMSWTNQDQQAIAADLLDPAEFSQIPLGSGTFTGWINVDPPTTPTGVTRTHSYDEGQETNLLQAHQDRSQLATNSYEWTTSVRVLSGASAIEATSFRPQFVLGFPMLGRRRTDEFPLPRLRFDVGGYGNVMSYAVTRDGATVPNIVWGRGAGYEDLQTQALVVNVDQYGKYEWDYGYLMSETRYSNPDVKDVNTLADHMYRLMWDKLGSERWLASLKVRGDLPPYFGTYAIGDDILLETNDRTWPSDWYVDGVVEIPGRIYGWTVTPQQGDTAETIDLIVGGGLPV